MKKLLFILPLTFIFISSFAQGEVEGTTEEEFRYITKGYKIQQESGLDMKRGYFFRDLGSKGISQTRNEITSYKKVELQVLYREANPEYPCAIMMIVKKGVKGQDEFKEYYCIPNPNSSNEIWLTCTNHFYQNIGEGNYKDALLGYSWGLAQFTATLMELADLEKVKAYELKLEEKRKEKN